MSTDLEFNLRFQKKQIEKAAAKASKDYTIQKEKAKKTLAQSGDIEAAKIFAENAIRQRSTQNQYLRLAQRIDATITKVKQAQSMQLVSKNLARVTKQVQKISESMNVEKIVETMDEFEKVFEDLDVSTTVMDNAMAQTTATVTPSAQVDALIRQIAQENDLEIADKLNELPAAQERTTAATTESDPLSQRLAELRNAS